MVLFRDRDKAVEDLRYAWQYASYRIVFSDLILTRTRFIEEKLMPKIQR